MIKIKKEDLRKAMWREVIEEYTEYKVFINVKTLKISVLTDTWTEEKQKEILNNPDEKIVKMTKWESDYDMDHAREEFEEEADEFINDLFNQDITLNI